MTDARVIELKKLWDKGYTLIEFEAGYMPYLIRNWAEAEKSLATAKTVIWCIENKVVQYKIYR
jgi:hypothetical protein